MTKICSWSKIHTLEL